MSHRRLFSLVLLLGFLAGCSSPGDDPPSPSPTPVVSVSASATPSAASPTPDMAALYAEADRVYRASLEAQFKFALTGDYSEFPPELASLQGPEFLATTRGLFELGKQEGYVLTGGVPSVKTRPLKGVSKGNSVAAIQTCYDARGLTLMDGQGQVVTVVDTLALGMYFFAEIDGQLKIIDSEIEEYLMCPID